MIATAESKPTTATAPSRPTLSIVVAATFTAEPVQATLEFWMRELGFEGTVEFAPYNQVFQQLLDPASALGGHGGVNLLLVRPEDWQRSGAHSGEDEEHASPPAVSSAGTAGANPACATSAIAFDPDKALRDADDFINAVKTAAPRAPATVILLCPPTPALLADAARRQALDALHDRIVQELRGVGGVHVITPAQLADLYPVAEYHDAQLDRMGHIPFTSAAFAAIGTMAARRIAAIKRPPHKVIVLDCDNTLWGGVVGEDGAEGIRVDGGFGWMQRFMVAQTQAGMVICLASKNVEEDVARAFELRQDMPLRDEHIVARKINWQPKSRNIAALAAELSLGLDSFIFVDDNPVECAEVRAALPQVLVLNLPKDEAAIEPFIRHVWEFDRLSVTSEDKQRTAMYKQNAQREQLLAKSLTFDEFLKSLDLCIDLKAPASEQMPRVSQLTQRTNQFNFTTIRRSQEEIERLLAGGRHHCLIVEVRDRFGDYGLVGVLLYEVAEQEIKIDSFMLSCRVLGRGVEHRMLQRLGEIAAQRGLGHVTAPFVPTKKNLPALNFLRSIGKEYEALLSEKYVFRFPAAYAANLTYAPKEAPTDLPTEGGGGSSSTAGAGAAADGERAQRIASGLNNAASILAAVEASRKQTRASLGVDFLAPRNDIERQIAAIWEDVLDVSPIGVHDDFFNLGGDSLLAVRILAEIERTFGRALPQQILFEKPTVELLVEALKGGPLDLRMPTLVPLNDKGSLPPFFAIAPADGIGLIYKELARCLGDDQPVYALNRKDLDFDQLREVSIEALAEYYIKMMKTVQPKGPYFLGGYCNGTYVAAEVARQLLAAGEKVPVLAVFDFWYCKEVPPDADRHQTLRGRWELLRQRDQRPVPVMLASLVMRKLAGFLGLGKRAQPVTATPINGSAPAQAVEPDAAAQAKVRQERFIQLGYQLQRKIQYRVPKPVDARITFFGASDGRNNVNYSDGWEKVALRGVDVHVVPGQHETILVRPNVEVLAGHLAKALANARDSARA